MAEKKKTKKEAAKTLSNNETKEQNPDYVDQVKRNAEQVAAQDAEIRRK